MLSGAVMILGRTTFLPSYASPAGIRQVHRSGILFAADEPGSIGSRNRQNSVGYIGRETVLHVLHTGCWRRRRHLHRQWRRGASF